MVKMHILFFFRNLSLPIRFVSYNVIVGNSYAIAFSTGASMEKMVSHEELTEKISTLRKSIEGIIVGKADVIRLAVCGFLAEGHILIEDLPGVGKTTLVHALARSIDGRFQRIQFTPDLLPSDITGIAVYDQDEKSFVFKEGPVFANLILADEINRTTPRTQSALLEAMNAGTVTVDGRTHTLPKPFMVIATQNPLEFTGTYLLPESQLDRFLMKIGIAYPSKQEEKEILLQRRFSDPIDSLQAVITKTEALALIDAVKTIRFDAALLDYLTEIINTTRSHRELLVGASPRASLGLYRASQAYAFTDGRDFVIPDDIKTLAVPALSHRVMPRERFKSTAVSAAGADIIKEIIESTPVPL